MLNKLFKPKKLAILLTSVLITTGITSCNSHSNTNSHSTDGNGGFSSLLGQSHGSGSNVTEQNWSYKYNSLNLLETATDPNGGVTRYDYDEQGRLTKVTNPLNQMISFTDFDKHGNPETIVDENDVTTKLTYTTRGWLHTVTIEGAVTTFTYDEVGNMTKLVMPDNTAYVYAYDDSNYLSSITNAGSIVNYTRDNAGNIITAYISGSKGTVYEDNRVYDEMNRLLKISTAISTINYGYDNLDNVTSITDGRNHKTSFGYDELQRLAIETNAKNDATKYTYDSSKNVDSPSSITDPKGTKTSYILNGLNQLLQLVSPDSGTHSYSAYDGNGNLLEQTDANGKQITYAYDKLDRPKTITYAGDSLLNTTFTYDSGSNAVGRLTKAQNGVSSNSYYYDARGNVISEVQTIDKTDYIIGYGYDKADHLTNIVYPSKNQVAYIYTNGQISKVISNGKTIADISHMPFGEINHITYGNGVTEAIDYNIDYSIKQVKLSNDLINREYSYYPNGQIKAITNLGSYDYDQLNSLTKASSNVDNHSYVYDKNQNRTSQTFNNQRTDYAIESSSNRLASQSESSGTTSYQYDNAGNIIASGDKKYSYDTLNRLKTVTMGDESKMTNDYNAFSQRILKTSYGNQYTFIYNSAGQLLEERNKLQNTVKDYVYVDGKLIAAIENGIIIYIVTDHNNAPQLAMDSTGRNIWSATYDPFGKATVINNYKLNIRADGQYEDGETGLYYNWYRYYDPSLGRYISSDPLGLQAGTNTYIYVNGNPINYTDPMGLFVGVDDAIVVSGAAVVVRYAYTAYRAYRAAVVVVNVTDNIANKSCDNDEKLKQKSPGHPNDYEDYRCKDEDGKVQNYKFKTPKGKSPKTWGEKNGAYGWIDKKGNVWAPSRGKAEHGGAQWDVQFDDGTHYNCFPGKKKQSTANGIIAPFDDNQ